MAFGDTVQWGFTAPTATPAEELMDATQTAAYLGIELRTLYYWIERNQMIDGVVIGGKRRWSRTIVANYVYGKFVEQQAQLAAQKGTAGVESTSR